VMLIDRAAPGDREKADTLLTWCIGMSRHSEMNPDPPRPSQLIRAFRKTASTSGRIVRVRKHPPSFAYSVSCCCLNCSI
jgi:hypothetical protein